jgi:hypothetical protein
MDYRPKGQITLLDFLRRCNFIQMGGPPNIFNRPSEVFYYIIEWTEFQVVLKKLLASGIKFVNE